jgi:hypothetical protein
VPKKEKPRERRKESEAEIVDRLLKKLPHADPSLKGAEFGTKPTPPMFGAATPGGTIRAATPGSMRIVPKLSAGAVWGRVALALLMGVAITQWPYDHACGFGLFGYLFGVAVVAATAVWAVVGSWQGRQAVAHGVALALVAWAGVLIAREVLPRTGYARTQAFWSCSAAAAAPAAGAAPGEGAVVPAAPGVADSLAAVVPEAGQEAAPPAGQETER